MSSSSKEAPGTAARFDKRPISVAVLALAKRLEVSQLRQLGLHDLQHGDGVGIPYYDRAGELIAVKKRVEIRAKDGSYWPARTPLAAYGDWKLHEAAKVGMLILVEGESDCWVLWHHGYPALGIPGSGATRTLTAEHLVGITKVYIHVEPDQGGQLFQEGILKRLAELKFTDQVFTFHSPEGIKDPAELHKEDPSKFPERFQLALRTAEPQTPAHVHLKVQPTTSAPSTVEPAAPKHEEKRVASAVRLIDVDEESVRWLWPGRIPLGKLTILDGDPGLGKSTVTLDIAARLTRGQAMPACVSPCIEASNVLILTAEDGLGDTIRPRLESAKADLTKVIALEGIKLSSGTLLPIWLPHNIHELHEIATAFQAKLVIIDPLMAYLPEAVNAHNDQSVRQALLPLSQFAETTGAAVMVVRHLNKQPGKNALYRGGGSIGIIGAARSGLLICKDPENEERRFLGVTKCNLCKQPRTLPFQLIDGPGSASVEWQDEVDFAIEAALAPESAEESDSPSEVDDFLRTCLADGAKPVAKLFEEAAEIRLSEKSLRRAKQRLKIHSRLIPSPDGKGGYWVWELAKAA